MSDTTLRAGVNSAEAGGPGTRAAGTGGITRVREDTIPTQNDTRTGTNPAQNTRHATPSDTQPYSKARDLRARAGRGHGSDTADAEATTRSGRVFRKRPDADAVGIQTDGAETISLEPVPQGEEASTDFASARASDENIPNRGTHSKEKDATRAGNLANTEPSAVNFLSFPRDLTDSDSESSISTLQATQKPRHASSASGPSSGPVSEAPTTSRDASHLRPLDGAASTDQQQGDPTPDPQDQQVGPTQRPPRRRRRLARPGGFTADDGEASDSSLDSVTPASRGIPGASAYPPAAARPPTSVGQPPPRTAIAKEPSASEETDLDDDAEAPEEDDESPANGAGVPGDDAAGVQTLTDAGVGGIIDGAPTQPPRELRITRHVCPSTGKTFRTTAEGTRAWRRHLWGIIPVRDLDPDSVTYPTQCEKASIVAGLLVALDMSACARCGEPFVTAFAGRHTCRARSTHTVGYLTRSKPGSAAAWISQHARDSSTSAVSWEVMAYLETHGRLWGTLPGPAARGRQGAQLDDAQAHASGRAPTHQDESSRVRAGDAQEWENRLEQMASRGSATALDPQDTLPFRMGLRERPTRRLIPKAHLDRARRDFTDALEQILLAAAADSTQDCSSHALWEAWTFLLGIPSRFAPEASQSRPCQERPQTGDPPTRAGVDTRYLIDELSTTADEGDSTAEQRAALRRARTLILEGRLSAAAATLLKPEPPVSPSQGSADAMHALHPADAPLAAEEREHLASLSSRSTADAVHPKVLTRERGQGFAAPSIPFEAAAAALQRVRSAASTKQAQHDPEDHKLVTLGGFDTAMARAVTYEQERQLGPDNDTTIAHPRPEPDEPSNSGSSRIRAMIPDLESWEESWIQGGGSTAPTTAGAVPPTSIRPGDDTASRLSSAEERARRRAGRMMVSLPRVSSLEVATLISSLPAHRAPGPSGFTYEMLRQLLGRDAKAFSLLGAIARLMLVGRGGPAHLLMASRLIALRKKGKDLRPIAVGETLTRLCGLVASRLFEDHLKAALHPEQLGVAISGGTEIAAWTAQLARLSGLGILSIDAKNAFNTVSRREVLRAVAEQVPAMLPLTTWALEKHTPLWFGKDTGSMWALASASGVPQGWPLSPALFALALQAHLRALRGTATAVTGLPPRGQTPAQQTRQATPTVPREELARWMQPRGGDSGSSYFVHLKYTNFRAQVDETDFAPDTRQAWGAHRWHRPVHRAATSLAERLRSFAPQILTHAGRQRLRDAADTALIGQDADIEEWDPRADSRADATEEAVQWLALADTIRGPTPQSRTADIRAWVKLTESAVSVTSPTLTTAWGEALAALDVPAVSNAAVWGYADDAHAAGDAATLSHIYAMVTLTFPTIGLQVRPEKCETLLPGESILEGHMGEQWEGVPPAVKNWLEGADTRDLNHAPGDPQPNPDPPCHLPNATRDGIVVVGTPVGTKQFTATVAMEEARKTGELLRRAGGLDRQLQFCLLRISATSRFRHLTRTLPRGAIHAAIATHDHEIQQALARILGIPDLADLGPPQPLGPTNPWQGPDTRAGLLERARDLPLRLGGLGVCPCAQTATAAFLGSLALVTTPIVHRFASAFPRDFDHPGRAMSFLQAVVEATEDYGERAEQVLARASHVQVQKAQRFLHQPAVERLFWGDLADLAYRVERDRSDNADLAEYDGPSPLHQLLSWRLANLSRGASSWIAASPVHPPNRLDDAVFQEAMAMRCGLHLEQGNVNDDRRPCHSCQRTPALSSSGIAHALSCTSRNKKQRHDRVVRELARAIRKTGAAVAVEAPVEARSASAPPGQRRMDILVQSGDEQLALDVTVTQTSVGGVPDEQKSTTRSMDLEPLYHFTRGAVVGPRQTIGTRQSANPTFRADKHLSPFQGKPTHKDPLGLTSSARRAAQRKWRVYGTQVIAGSPTNPSQFLAATVVPIVVDSAGGVYRPSMKALRRLAQTISASQAAADAGTTEVFLVHNMLQAISTAVVWGNRQVWGAHSLERFRGTANGPPLSHPGVESGGP